MRLFNSVFEIIFLKLKIDYDEQSILFPALLKRMRILTVLSFNCVFWVGLCVVAGPKLKEFSTAKAVKSETPAHIAPAPSLSGKHTTASV